MRKQDRIANQQDRSQDTDRSQSQPSSSDTERMRGSESPAQRPQRQSGKLPLPD